MTHYSDVRQGKYDRFTDRLASICLLVVVGNLHRYKRSNVIRKAYYLCINVSRPESDTDKSMDD